MLSAILKDKRNIVRAWFDTVLNPIIDGLTNESDLLRLGRFTWRASAGRFASLLPVRSYVALRASVNLDQFLSFYPQLQLLVPRHDQLLDSLQKEATSFISLLSADPTFRAMARELSGPANAPIGEEEAIKVLAEYVLNSVQGLSNFYSTADFWNSRVSEFLALRDHPEIRPHWDAVVAAAELLRQAAEELTNSLATIRGELSLEHDVPLVAK